MEGILKATPGLAGIEGFYNGLSENEKMFFLESLEERESFRVFLSAEQQPVAKCL